MKKLWNRTGSVLAALALMVCLFSLSMPVSGAGETFELTPVGSKEPVEISLSYDSPEALLKDMKKVSAGGSLELYFHETYLIAAVLDTATGEIYSTNPYNADLDPFSTGQIQKLLRSQVVLSYSDSSGKINTLWSATDCVELGQFEVTYTEKGVSVTYSLGEEKTRRLVPEVIGKEAFEAVLEKLSENAKAVRRLKALYKEATLEDGRAVYRAKKLNNKELDEVDGYFAAAGYTMEDLDADYASFGLAPPDTVFPNFQLTVEYTLTDRGLRVNIPADKFRYDTKSYYITDIKALEYFGAVNADQGHEGYVFLPDGSGTLLRFDDQTRNRQQLISGQVYGFDSSVSYPDEPRQGRTFHLPVFGIKKDNAGFFAIVTDGAALTSLSGYAGSQFGRYFAAFPTFRNTTREELELEQKVASFGSVSTAYLNDKNIYTGAYTVEYTFLNDTNSSYMGMAELYRAYLVEQGMTLSEKGAEHFLSIETLGTLTYTDKFLGIPYSASAKLTTFDQNREVLEFFQKEDVTALNLTLTSWRRGGLESTAANRFDPASVLGGKKEFTALGNWCKENGVGFYPDIDLPYVARDGWFDGFSANKDTTRLLNDHFGGLMTVRPDTSRYDRTTFRFALAPRLYAGYLDKFLKGYDKTGLDSLGLGTLGQYLNSDFRDKKEMNRQQNLKQMDEILSKASAEHALTFAGGNAYVLPYAAFVRGVPMTDSGYPGTVGVPFLQLVLNGAIPYSSEPVNMQNDPERALLECIESGTSPHYVLAMDNILKIKLTQHTEYYSVDGRYWLESAAQGYARYEAALEATDGAVIISHEQPASGVAKVSWSNGAVVFVNYNDTAYAEGDVTVPARDSLTVRGQEK